jgi:hypothetical protein
MKHWTGEAAAALILASAAADDIFGECAGDARKVKRLYRVLAFAVHPDRASLEGIDAKTAADATRLLNARFAEADPAQAPKPQPKAATPHLVGKNATFILGDRVSQTTLVSTYRTSEPGVHVDISRTATDATAALADAAAKLAAQQMSAFTPEVLDRGATSGHAWIAYRVPAGTVTLRQVRDAYPSGLDGRDWAWMARRIFMVLDIAGAHGALSLDTVRIHPEQHGVVLTGWGTTGAADADGTAIRDLFAAMLAPSETRQRAFANASVHVAPGRVLAEYDLLLRHLYGERRFRPFVVPTKA